MADYYDNFAASIEGLTKEESAWIEVDLKECNLDGLPDDEKKAFIESKGIDDEEFCWPRFYWSLESGFLFLGDDGGYFSQDHLVSFVKRFLAKWRPKDVVPITIASMCSAPRTGEFGGAWIVISAKEARSNNTWRMADQLAGEMKGEVLQWLMQ